jgi:hypothetical protein
LTLHGMLGAMCERHGTSIGVFFSDIWCVTKYFKTLGMFLNYTNYNKRAMLELQYKIRTSFSCWVHGHIKVHKSRGNNNECILSMNTHE